MESKPSNILLKDFLIRRMVVDMGIPEKTIRTTIDDAFNNATKATTTCKSVEISGWGVFHFYDKKAKKMLEKYKSQIRVFTDWLENKELSPTKRRGTEAKLLAAKKNLEDLMPRIDE